MTNAEKLAALIRKNGLSRKSTDKLVERGALPRRQPWIQIAVGEADVERAEESARIRGIGPKRTTRSA